MSIAHIKQQYAWDCGVACAAMYSHCPYSAVLYLCAPLVVDAGIYGVNMASLLRHLTGVAHRFERGAPSDQLSVCLLETDRAGGHWVFKSYQTIYDPLEEGPDHIDNLQGAVLGYVRALP